MTLQKNLILGEVILRRS